MKKFNIRIRNLNQLALWQRNGKGFHGKSKTAKNRNERRKAKQQGWD